jgi:uncharacterized protein
MISRLLKPQLTQQLFMGKVIVIIGARQIGKTTLLQQIISEYQGKTLWLNADEADVRTVFNNASTSTQLLQLFGDAQLMVIDEAQLITDIGLKLKLYIDTKPTSQLIISGSSAFDLLNTSNEPLTGRNYTFTMYPLYYQELVTHTNTLQQKRLLETRLIMGAYPEIVTHTSNALPLLKQLTNSYLYKDILKINGIKKTHLLDKLLLALALQIGNEVSYNELAQIIGGADAATVEKYISLLEKAYVIFKLHALNRNLRNEIKKGKKIYFYDNGVLNAITNNFNAIHLRADKGALWENYLISERLKRNAYNNHYCNTYFWRRFDQTEVDYIEEYNGALHLYEFKWANKRTKMPQSIQQAYAIASTTFIDTNNYEQFLSE